MPPPHHNHGKRQHSVSPQKPARKRGRGGGQRGRGHGQGSGRAKAAISQGETEDVDGGSPDTAKSDDEELKVDEDDEIFTSARWTDEERSTLFSYYLGPEADDMFKQLKSNAKYARGKVGPFSSGDDHGVLMSNVRHRVPCSVENIQPRLSRDSIYAHMICLHTFSHSRNSLAVEVMGMRTQMTMMLKTTTLSSALPLCGRQAVQ